MIRTKIVATLGPATSSVETLARLFEEGVDVCRLNFSHGDVAEHQGLLANVRKAAGGQPIAVLGDLCGPKIRLGKVADHDGTGGMPIGTGDSLRLVRQAIVGEAGRVSSTHPEIIDDIRTGDRLLVEDGLIRFIVTEKRPDEIVLACTVGGVLKSSKGINLPDTPIRISPITEADWRFANWAIDNDLDYLALSFVRRPDELRTLREHLRKRSSGIQLVAKIEKPEAIEHIDAIIDATDALMVARGDLGVEMDVAQVPTIQKDLIKRCLAAGKSVIVATQMLQSMIDQATPTRAEVSDVANAIYDGTDAVMLSGETSVGKYPLPAVHTMNHVAEVTEEYLARSGDEPRITHRARRAVDFGPGASAAGALTGGKRDGAANVPPVGAPAAPNRDCPDRAGPPVQLSEAVAHGVRQIVCDVGVKLVVLWSQTGTTARIFSKHRFPVPIIALSSDDRALRRMALYYGVLPQKMPRTASMSALIGEVDRLVTQAKFAAAGDQIVLVAGSSLGTPGTTNGIVVHTVGQGWSPVSGRSEKP